MIFLLFLLFIGNVYAQDYDAQIKSLDDQRNYLLAQRQEIIDGVNDPDIQLLKRLKAKTAAQRALADQSNVLLAQKEQIMKSREYADYQQVKAEKIIADAKAQEISDAKNALAETTPGKVGENWSDLNVLTNP